MLIARAAIVTMPKPLATIIIGPNSAMAPMDRADRPPTIAIAPTATFTSVDDNSGLAWS